MLELEAEEQGVVDLSMRGWRSLDEVELDAGTRRLQLEHNNLAKLPATLGKLDLMVHLDVSSNALESLPNELGQCTRLRVLRCKNNHLTRLPDELGDCAFLEEIAADHNRLTTVPASLGRLRVLRVISLQHNRLTELPYEIGGLRTLETLDCTGNADFDMVPDALRDDATMVRFAMRLHYDTAMHVQAIKDDHAALEAGLLDHDEANLRLRDAIKVVNKDKARIVASLVPGACCGRTSCAIS